MQEQGLTKQMPAWRYSPKPLEAYFLSGVGRCPFRVMDSMPEPRRTAVWNVVWLCDSRVDDLENNPSNWPEFYGPVPGLLQAVINDVFPKPEAFVKHPTLMMDENLPLLMPSTLGLLGTLGHTVVWKRLGISSERMISEDPLIRAEGGRLKITMRAH